jgi:hypothetical protein
MTFVFPIVLGGLALLAIPILLHLLMRQKPKRLPFPAFRFLVQKHRSNQTKLRLRHLLLLLLRMLLLALICLAIAQPRLGQPVAAVLIFDTSYSMEYKVGPQSRLDEAKKRGLELLEDLPEESKVAILDTAETGGDWLTLTQAKEKVKSLQLRSDSAAVTDRLKDAHALFDKLATDTQNTRNQNLTRFLCIFSDNTRGSWSAQNLPREEIPADTKLLIDLSPQQPADLAIIGLDFPPKSGVRGPQRNYFGNTETFELRATVRATGADFNTELKCVLEDTTLTRSINLKASEQVEEKFTIDCSKLRPGFHSLRVHLAVPDSLPFNDTRYATFAIADWRPILILVDKQSEQAAKVLATSIDADPNEMFKTTIQDVANLEITKEDLTNPKKEPFRNYKAVYLLQVKAPDTILWQALHSYVKKGGGLAIIPPEDKHIDKTAYATQEAADLLPGTLEKVIDHQTGAVWEWDDPRTYQHPLLRPVKAWEDLGLDLDFRKFPRRAFFYWEVKPNTDNVTTVVSYEQDKSPAILERTLGTGKCLLLTTPLDQRSTWNNYMETATSFCVVFPGLLTRYLAGDFQDQRLNFAGPDDPPRVRLPSSNSPTFNLIGPEVVLTFTRKQDEQERIFREPLVPGNYLVEDVVPNTVGAFSVNLPGGESQLDRVPAPEIEPLLGPGTAMRLDPDASLAENLPDAWPRFFKFLPWLLLGLLVLLALENLLSNLFYRKEPKKEGG